ncbi:GtrA family protein [Agaribacterium sp. ZY112]|uniref:GtrA family protein n=1 Tax=Agaribacterium sp. ZY112 TaxID=3233574 RepID=UPI0035233DB5
MTSDSSGSHWFSRLRQHQIYKEFQRFFLSGLGATAIHYALMIWLVELGMRPTWLASSIGFICSAVVNFLLARYLVFDSKAPWKHAGLRYVLMIGGGLLINAIALAYLNSFIHYLIAQIGATGLVFIYNFFASKYWVHKSQ